MQIFNNVFLVNSQFSDHFSNDPNFDGPGQYLTLYLDSMKTKAIHFKKPDEFKIQEKNADGTVNISLEDKMPFFYKISGTGSEGSFNKTLIDRFHTIKYGHDLCSTISDSHDEKPLF